VPGTRRWPLTLLAVLLVVWEPVSFALYASSVVARLPQRGTYAILWLAARIVVVGIGIAAGLALWNDRPGAIVLARLAVAASAAAVIVGWMTSALPDNRPPGAALPVTLALIAYNAAWLVYLFRIPASSTRDSRNSDTGE
jgi:hypothetical protein